MLLPNLQAEFIENLFSNNSHDNFCIYQNNIFSILIQTLKKTYPLLFQKLGKDLFELTAKNYIHQYPSRSALLAEYGEYLNHFLSEHPPTQHLQFLPELATLEWACHVSSGATDVAELDIHLLETFNRNQFDQLHFTLHPASQVISFRYPILDILKNNIDETYQAESTYVLVMRYSFEVTSTSLTQAEFVFLQNLSTNTSLLSAFEAAKKYDVNFKLEEKLPHWIKNKILIDCYLQT